MELTLSTWKGGDHMTAHRSLMSQAIALGREIMQLTNCTPCELREVIPFIMPCLTGPGDDDMTCHLGGNDWRFTRRSSCEAILADEFSNGEIAEDYMVIDNPGHHFAYYDGSTHELSTIDFYAFNQG